MKESYVDGLFSGLLMSPFFRQPCFLGGVCLCQAEIFTEDLIYLDALKHNHLKLKDTTREVLVN